MNKKEMTQRSKAVQMAMKDCNKQFGKNSVMRLGDDKAIMHLDTIPSGSVGLDHVLGVNGYARGRITVIGGAESSGKTTLALSAAAQAQKQGGLVFYLDTENAISPEYAKHMGVDMNALVLSQPDTGEEGVSILERMTKSAAFSLVVVDSIAALLPKAEIEADISQQHVGLQARLVSAFMRRISPLLNKTNTACILLDQQREDINSFFNGKTLPGGLSLRFYSSVILNISPGTKIKDKGEVIGKLAKVTAKKNKVAPPFKSCRVPVMNGSEGLYGINTAGELIGLSSKIKSITDVQKSGPWYHIFGHKIIGTVPAYKFLNSHPDLTMKLAIEVRTAKHMPLTVTEKDFQKNPSKYTPKESQSAKVSDSSTKKAKK